LWRLIPASRGAELAISGFSVLGWFLTSATIAIVSTCPVSELNFNAFVHARPFLCIFLGMLPVTTALTRIVETPLPRWISCLVSVTMLAHGFMSLHALYCSSSRSAVFASYWQWLPSFAVLMEVWYLDVIVSSTVNEIALLEWEWTDLILAVHATVALVLQCWLWWRHHPSTLRFYVGSYVAITWNSSYFACRGIDLSMGNKDWDVGRQHDIAVAASFAIAGVVLLPPLLLVVVGRQHLFDRLAKWLDQSRRLQDGAFMAMLLDSYLVEVGQPWWLSAADMSSKKNAMPKTSIDRSGTSSFAKIKTVKTLPDECRPGFVKGQIVKVAEDGKSFWVMVEEDGDGAEHSEHVEIHRKQQVMPWRALLKLGRQRLRCVDWASQNLDMWMQSSGAGFEKSRPVGKGEVIDFFVSHSWSDDPEQKWRALELLAESFQSHHGRFPTFWVDKFCIDQRQIADGLRLLPVNVMACRQVLVLCGPSYPQRLWCAWELCVLMSFMPVGEALKLLTVMPLSQAALQQLTRFETEASKCFDPNEELRLRTVIKAIGIQRFEQKIRTLGRLILDRNLTESRGLLVDAMIGDGEGEDDQPREVSWKLPVYIPDSRDLEMYRWPSDGSIFSI